MASTHGEDKKNVPWPRKGNWRINLSDLKFEVLSQEFLRRVENPQLMFDRKKRVHYIL